MSRRRLRRRMWVAICSLGLCSAPALAQDKAMAAELFDSAEHLMAAGRLGEACPKYAESQRIDPQLGTLLHLAECYAANGQSASAWAHFKDALELAIGRNDAREEPIRERLAGLEPHVARLTLLVRSPEQAQLQVTRDGTLVGKPAWGVPLPIDPGDHEVAASAPGHADWGRRFSVPSGAQLVIEVPALDPTLRQPAPTEWSAGVTAGAPPDVLSTHNPVLGSTEGKPRSDASPDRHAHARRVAGWSVIGLGTLGVVTGVVFEIKSVNTLSERDDVCPARVDCPIGSNDRIAELTGEARDARFLGNLGLIAGGLVAVGGAVLLLTAPSSEEPQLAITPVICPRLQGLSVVGSL